MKGNYLHGLQLVSSIIATTKFWAAEHVFSLFENSFNDQQRSLEDYIETSVMNSNS